MEKKSYIVVILICVGIFAFCTTKIAAGKEAGRCEVDEKYYVQWEQEYRQSVRTVMEDNGMENSGITMTKTIDGEGNRTYSVALHHRMADRLSQGEKAKLLLELGKIVFPVETCGFSYNFI